MTGPDLALALFGIGLAIYFVIQMWIADAETDAVCQGCGVCAQRRQRIREERAEAKVTALIRAGRCPRCKWSALRDGHCSSCDGHWRA